jgi:hypothetical protein
MIDIGGGIMIPKAQLRTLGLILVILLLAAACQGSGEPQEVGDLPTLMVLPSVTASLTFTATVTPSPTDTPTSTSTPTNTPTPTSTLSPTPRATFTPSITSTFTLTPTFTFTPLPTATSTPSITPTPNAPQILSFTANLTTVPANSSVTLTWNAVGDTARIDLLNQQGAVSQTFPVVPTGSLPVTVPGNLGRAPVYRLVVQRGGQEITRSIAITIQCSTSWFFGDQFAPPNAGCPTAVGAIGPGAFQQFERGYMLYVNANSLNTVYGLQNDGNRYINYLNGWDGVTVETCASSPPSGLFAPQGIFNWAYCRTNAPVGIWSQQIGWAVGNIDNGQRTIQFEDGTGAFYVDAPVGVFRFSGASSNSWTKIK